jgi:hypothetical protein
MECWLFPTALGGVIGVWVSGNNVGLPFVLFHDFRSIAKASFGRDRVYGYSFSFDSGLRCIDVDIDIDYPLAS